MNASLDRRRATLEAAAQDVADVLARIDAEDCGLRAAPHLDYALHLLRVEITTLTTGTAGETPKQPGS